MMPVPMSLIVGLEKYALPTGAANKWVHVIRKIHVLAINCARACHVPASKMLSLAAIVSLTVVVIAFAMRVNVKRRAPNALAQMEKPAEMMVSVSRMLVPAPPPR